MPIINQSWFFHRGFISTLQSFGGLHHHQNLLTQNGTEPSMSALWQLSRFATVSTDRLPLGVEKLESRVAAECDLC